MTMPIADNFDLYEYEERQRAWAEARRPHCTECGDAIWEDYAYRIGDSLICEACMESAREYIEED